MSSRDSEREDVEALERTFEQLIMFSRYGKYLLILFSVLQGLYVISEFTHIPISVLLMFLSFKFTQVLKWFKMNIWLRPYIDAMLWMLMIVDLVISYRLPFFEKLSPAVVIPLTSLGLSFSIISMIYGVNMINTVLCVVYASSLAYALSGKSSVVELRRGMLESRLAKSPEPRLQLPYPADIAVCEYYPKNEICNSKRHEGHTIYWICGEEAEENKHCTTIEDYSYDRPSTGHKLNIVEEWENPIVPVKPYEQVHYYEGHHSAHKSYRV